MQSHFHGGLCCGIKHITGFYSDPSEPVLSGNKKEASQKRNHDKGGDNVMSEWDFCWEALPVGLTWKDTFLAYVDFIKRVRPAGVIECTLTDAQTNLYGWGKVLKETGFKCVAKFYNSNSGNKLYSYYLVYGEQSEDCFVDDWCDEDEEDEEDEDDYYNEED